MRWEFGLVGCWEGTKHSWGMEMLFVCLRQYAEHRVDGIMGSLLV